MIIRNKKQLKKFEKLPTILNVFNTRMRICRVYGTRLNPVVIECNKIFVSCRNVPAIHIVESNYIKINGTPIGIDRNSGDLVSTHFKYLERFRRWSINPINGLMSNTKTKRIVKTDLRISR